MFFMQVQFVHLNKNFEHRDKRGFDLISDALPFGRLLYREPDQEHTSRCHVCSVPRAAGANCRTSLRPGVFENACKV